MLFLNESNPFPPVIHREGMIIDMYSGFIDFAASRNLLYIGVALACAPPSII